jgi:hypothetical protein
VLAFARVKKKIDEKRLKNNETIFAATPAERRCLKLANGVKMTRNGKR